MTKCPCQECYKDGKAQKCAMVCGHMHDCDKVKEHCNEVKEYKIYRMGDRGNGR